jgi:hypothetical protein
MATVQLADIIDVTVFQDLPAVNSPEKTAFYEGGVIARSPLLDTLANAPGKIAELPFWNDLDETSAPNISNDDPASSATPDKITQGKQIGRALYLNKGWSASNLATELAMGENAMSHIRNRSDKYWTRQFQRYLIAGADGVLADNVANDSGDMVSDVAIEDGDNAAAANLFSRSNFTSAAFTLGDAFENTGVIGVHSVVYKRMVDNDDIDFIPDSQGRLTIPTFMGKRVIVDDGMTTVAGSTSGFKYTTVLFGEGAFGYGEGMPAKPVAVESKEAQGNGAGVETLWTRKTQLIHPFGFQFTSGSVAGDSATIAEMKLAANWDRVVARKNVPLAFLITNG